MTDLEKSELEETTIPEEDLRADGAENASGRPTLESFLPTELYRDETRKKARKKRRSLILCLFLALIVAAGIWGYSYYRRLTTRTAELFAATPSPKPAATAVLSADPGKKPVQEPMPDPFAVLDARNSGVPDLEGMDNILNVALIGVDYSAERENWRGKDGISAAHADVIIVLAVNFDKNTATLISLPRDTYTRIPGVSGIYKLNAALNCGGGMNAEDGAGFKKVCETASYLLGGIPVNYYYAVTMPAVKELVDAIGGVDYRLDVSFTMQHRTYYAGRQHMNGQGVLDYLRVRKEASGLDASEAGDVHRVQRQKKMLVAIFNQLKKKDTLRNIPEILEAFDGQLFTNCSKEQTLSLAMYGYNMDSSNISMKSMTGTGGTLYSWNFSFIRPENRRKLIEEVYGIEVPDLPELTKSYAKLEQQIRIANKCINTCHPLTVYIDGQIASSQDIADAQRSMYERLQEELQNCIDARNGTSAGAISRACSSLKHYASIAARTFGYPGELSWKVPLLADTNEIYVDFR